MQHLWAEAIAHADVPKSDDFAGVRHGSTFQRFFGRIRAAEDCTSTRPRLAPEAPIDTVIPYESTGYLAESVV